MNHSPQFERADRADYWGILVARKWIITALVLISVCATAFAVLKEPKLYEAQVEFVVLSPAWENNRGALVAPVVQNLGRPFRPLKLVLLESIYWELWARVLVEAIVEELGLQAHYGTATLAETVRVLEGHRSIIRTQQGTMRVRIVDRDPQIAAAIANAHVRHLDLLDRQMLARSAAMRKQFIKARVREAESKLARAEEEWFPLRFIVDAAKGEFENEAAEVGKSAEGKMPDSVEGQEQEQITPLTRITKRKVQAMEMEVELARLHSFATANHPEVLKVEAQLRTLRQAIDQLEHGRSSGHPGVQPSFVPSLAELPGLALPSERLARAAKDQARYYLLWNQMLEDTSIEGTLDLPRIWVLDHAVPEKRHRRLWQKLIVACGLALILGGQLCFLFAYLARLRDHRLSVVPKNL
jgi:uncharacterized protein involved in exopolysaccharide biosynthesis